MQAVKNVLPWLFWGSIIVVYIVLTSGKTTNTSSTSGSPSYRYDDYSYENEYEDEGTGVTSDNWSCTDDCSGHEAGYDWAENHSITDPYDCDGNSDSFIEGCEAYANEQLQESDYEEDYDDSYYDYP